MKKHKHKQLTQQPELLIPTIEKLLFVLQPEFIAKSSQVRVLVDGRVFPIKKISCHYVYGDDVEKTVFLEI